ncbi:putative peptide ABC transporter substrate-binding protein [metagenome]|uniref:Putative peptide ABC transporter substrate-binding protein n=1 Tax=metagenome TaxID=256318 RepID=A0A2P2CFK1_9ZZZZ
MTGLDRRSFLGISLGAGAALTLAACSGAAGGAGGSTSGGGVVKWAWQLPTTWDPVTSSAGSDVHMLALTYSSLTQLDDEGSAIPHLAESWKYNADGTEITLTLKKGLEFSDGSPLDATAVKKSLERGRDADNSLIAPQLADLSKVTATGDTTVVLTLAGPNYQYPNLLAGKTGMVVNPAVFEKDADSLATTAAGSGPFVLDSYVQNSKGVLTKNPTYFQASDIKLSGFELYPAADPATVVAAVQSGQYNTALLPGSQVEAAKAAGLEVQVIPSMFVAVLDVNLAKAPFTDPAAAEALKYAINREELIKTGQFGIGEVNYQPFPPGYVGFDPTLGDLFAYDPDKATSILKEAGLTDPVPVTITAYAAEGVPELVQAQLNAVGFDAKIETIPIAQFTQKIYIQHSAALAVDGFAGRESPVQAFQVLFSDTGLMNPSRQSSPELQAALAKVIETPLDDPEYAGLLQAATALAVKTYPNTFLYTVPRVIARAKSVSELPTGRTLVRWDGVTVS